MSKLTTLDLYCRLGVYTMVNRSQQLQAMLVEILGSQNVYYQPPASVYINYPAIVFKRLPIRNTFADDEVYRQSHQYQLTVIDSDPDSEIVEKVSKLPKIRHDRHFASDNLYHDVFIINY